jgi:ribosomal protein S6
MLQRYAKCPVCKKRTVLKVSSNDLRGVKRYPYSVKVRHETHYFYVNLDSQGRITDILPPKMVE